MDFSNVKAVNIGNQNVKAIHDSNNTLLWSKEVYDVHYNGDTTQQTYSGKNIFNPNWNWSLAKVAMSFDSVTQKLTVTTTTGTGNKYADFYIPASASTDYAFSVESIVASNTSQTNFARIIEYNDSTSLSISHRLSPSDKSETFTTDAQCNSLRILVYSGVSGSVDDTTVYEKLQLESGSTVTSYEPYVGGIPAPNPDYPQTVNTVTGRQVVTISDGGSQSQSYTVDLGSIELCKIGTYQDYIYKSGDDWYIHKTTGRQDVNSANVLLISNYANVEYGSYDKPSNSINKGNYSQDYPVYFTHATYGTTQDYNVAANNGKLYMGASGNYYWVGFPKNTGLDTIKSELTGSLLYYILAVATDTQITNADLVAQLNAINDILVKYGYSYTVSGNLPLIINTNNI